ncbi:hypothetical protein QTJ16_004019 [Diplocarpon rosae]|uniref:Uncharacterized protein n=1 Tax=Diplocarpon rosae TaxID=946125 RepID=A0AAD9T1H5_9HELO|nr:hypothetical protein QTJ16_004019 [Diplocarpon rosae]
MFRIVVPPDNFIVHSPSVFVKKGVFLIKVTNQYFPFNHNLPTSIYLDILAWE